VILIGLFVYGNEPPTPHILVIGTMRHAESVTNDISNDAFHVLQVSLLGGDTYHW
jgi:hypothetical protein